MKLLLDEQLRSPAATGDYSPAFQRWDVAAKGPESRQGRQTAAVCRMLSFAPPGLGSNGSANPALKRWAIFRCPCGTIGLRLCSETTNRTTNPMKTRFPKP